MPESYAIKSGMAEADGGGGVAFPLVFFDGERETDIGNIVVYPTLEFKRFQSMLSQKIGISPHQFSVYLSSQDTGRRIPITGRVNFGAISREKGYSFLVVLKRSRRERRRRSQQESAGDVYFTSPMKPPPQKPVKKNPPDNVMLLRRDVGIINQDQAFSGPQLNLPYAYRVEYEKRVRDLQFEKERYLMNMGLTGSDLSYGENGMVGEKGGRGGEAVCEVCLEAKEMGKEVGFHWCIYDTVTVGFRSPAGPIARPIKGSD
ncbi:hypothetical protein FEM48_Zijuj12G0070000 [Ziziphus jujuba var. spinosa]|uniref:DUF7138 domain-containing protein n=1 Tax=Ziziphus jujuba var. spinosa TaxID=714518 RepID=A0A978UBV3_ZIZJJ|nr:hypothetical protein FEM48_Zijuj12G0070000 [Ziziphus jujuba var. spinosa]